MLSLPALRQQGGDLTVQKLSKALAALCALICFLWGRHYRKYKNAIDKPSVDLWKSHSFPSWFRAQCCGRETLSPNELDKVETSSSWKVFAHRTRASHWPKLKGSRGKRRTDLHKWKNRNNSDTFPHSLVIALEGELLKQRKGFFQNIHSCGQGLPLHPEPHK